MSALDRLAEIEGRADAATEGPWFVDRLKDVDGRVIYHIEDVLRWKGFKNVLSCDEDLPTADFIAHARTDVPLMAAALRAVLELANEYADQPTDYDEDTEAEIAVGRKIRDAITEALA